MKRRDFMSTTLAGGLALTAVNAAAQNAEPPVEWTEPVTGHRVVRLSREAGSQSLYFHQNAYSPDGQKLIMTTPSGLATINLKTQVIEKIVAGRVNVIVTGRKSGLVYYVKDRVVFATHLDTEETREIARLPLRGLVASVNAKLDPKSLDSCRPELASD